MPHLKCEACRYRLNIPRGQLDRAAELCPGCGTPLAPVGRLSEVVGLRAIGPSPRGEASISSLAEARESLETSRWLDDRGDFSPEAVAQAVALDQPAHSPDRRHSHEDPRTPS